MKQQGVARVAESVDARDLKSLAFRGVPVQVWPRAPFKITQICGNSSVGRARPCQGRGREFEPRFPLHFKR